MDHILWFVLQIFDSVTFGWFSRGGTRHGGLPDAAEVWDEEERRLDRGRLECEALVGRIGTAVTPLRPSGKVDVNRRHYEATSEAGFIDAGSRVEVIGRIAFVLVVRERSA
jgi:membrane-bound ClpP family serine protease